MYGTCVSSGLRYFDSHIHFFPDVLASKALPKLSSICGCPYYTDGTKEQTLQKLEEWNCQGGLGLHIATQEKQQTAVNNFAAASMDSRLLCFGSVFPGASDALSELERIRELGLLGVKLHPDYQDFFVEDEKALPIYEKAEKLGLPIAFHTGRDPYSPNHVHCHPKALGHIADLFPSLTILAAHMGGMDMPEEAARYLAGKKNVYFDTAFASHFLTPGTFSELVALYGADRILFATDCPWSTAPAEKELLLHAGIEAVNIEKIAWYNSAALFNFSC